MKTYTKKLLRILDAHGLQRQCWQLIEECAELIIAVCKFWRDDVDESAKDKKHIVDELADVRIMTDQIALAYGVVDQVDERIRYKVERELGRIEDGSDR